MSTPFLGQIQAFGFGIVPKGWAACNGQLLQISQNQALFSLLGTQFGGNGQTTFALPNLQGSFALHQGPTNPVGQAGGEVNHTLTNAELAPHVHPMVGSSAPGTASSPATNFPGVPGNGASLYSTGPNATLAQGSSYNNGGGAHPNMPPYLAMNYCIALQGIFPSRN